MNLGYLLIIVGLLLVALGVLWLLGQWIGLGRLPGDIVFKTDGVTIYIPLMTSIILSILLSIIVWLIGRWWS